MHGQPTCSGSCGFSICKVWIKACFKNYFHWSTIYWNSVLGVAVCLQRRQWFFPSPCQPSLQLLWSRDRVYFQTPWMKVIMKLALTNRIWWKWFSVSSESGPQEVWSVSTCSLRTLPSCHVKPGRGPHGQVRPSWSHPSSASLQPTQQRTTDTRMSPENPPSW